MKIWEIALTGCLSGGVFVALVELAKSLILWRKNRDAVKEDRAEQRKDDAEKKAALNTEKRLAAIEAKTDAQSEALRFIIYDRIRHIALAYIADGEVDFDDRRILNDMHRSYHHGLGGNGDLDNLMSQVNALPLKIEKS